MGDVTFDYTPSDGATLVLDGNGLNKNLHSNTAQKGIYSEMNGAVQWANMAGSAEIKPAHLHRRAASDGMVVGLRRSVDHFDESFLDSDDAAVFVPISGLNIKKRLNYQAGMLFWQWSLFVSVWRLRERIDNSTLADPPDILIKAFRGTTAIGATTRNMPETIHQYNSDQIYTANESLMTRHFDMSYMETNVAAGVHDLWIGVYVERQKGQEDLRLPEGRGSAHEIKSHHRFTVGVRNARVVDLV